MSAYAYAGLVVGMILAIIILLDGWLVLRKKWTISYFMQFVSGSEVGGWLMIAVWFCVTAHLFFPWHGPGHLAPVGLLLTGFLCAMEVLVARVMRALNIWQHWSWMPSWVWLKIRAKTPAAGFIPAALGFAIGSLFW